MSRMVMGKDGFTIIGAGFSVSEVGDVNEDGIADLMVSSYYDWRGRSNAYLVSVPSNVSSPPTFLPSSLPSSSPSQSPTVFPSLLVTIDPSNHPPFLTAWPTPCWNKSSQPTAISFSSSRPSPDTKKPIVIRRTNSPTIAPTSSVPSPFPSLLFSNTSTPAVRTRHTRPPRTVSPSRLAITVAPTTFQTVNWNGVPFSIIYCVTPGEYYGSPINQNFIIIGTGVFHIVCRSTVSKEEDVKVFSFSPLKNEIWIDGFDPRSDILDLIKYDDLRSLEDVSYSTNTLRIYLPVPSTDALPSHATSRSKGDAHSLQPTPNKRGSRTAAGKDDVIISQQIIVIVNLKDLDLLSSRNFLFIRRPGIVTSTTQLDGLIAFGLIVLGSVFSAVLANLQDQEDSKGRERYS